MLCLITFHAQICNLCGQDKVKGKEAATLFKKIITLKLQRAVRQNPIVGNGRFQIYI
jgi:hypothetical protein